jgi:hypothetical protein
MIKLPPESAKQYLIHKKNYFEFIYFTIEIAFHGILMAIFFAVNKHLIGFLFLLITIISWFHGLIALNSSEYHQPLTISRIAIYIQSIAKGWLNQSRIKESIFNQSIEEYKAQTEQIIKLQQEIFELEQKQFDADLRKSLKGDDLDWHIYKVINLLEKPF